MNRAEMAVAFGRRRGFASGRLGANWTPDGTLQLEGESNFSLSWGTWSAPKTTLYGVVFQNR